MDQSTTFVPTAPQPPTRKKRSPRACDACRRRKAKCHGGGYLGAPCANCAAFGDACTYNEYTGRRGPQRRPTQPSTPNLQPSVPTHDTNEALALRIRELEALLEKASPGATSGSPMHLPSPNNPISPEAQSSHAAPSSFEGDASDLSTDEELVEPLAERISKLRLNPLYPRLAVGQWSGRKLVESAREMKRQVFGGSSESGINKRPEKWVIPDWEKHVVVSETRPTYEFPPEDLASTLINNFFSRFNPYMPLFHRPSFIENIASDFHLHDSSFAATYLLVCAIGSWYCDDPRVFLEEGEPRSAGWKWFNQVDITRRSPYAPPTLYDFQTYCLSLAVLHSSSTPAYCWITAGIGLRMAMDVGIHRRKAYGSDLTPYAEQLKRAFWALVTIDHIVATATGRPTGINDDDIDLDLPTAYDDEYWTASEARSALRQPEGKITQTYFFVHILRLREIENYALKSLFPAKRSRFGPRTGGHQWEQQVVADIDSHLNEWLEVIPSHLQWEHVSDNTDTVTYHHAAFLRNAFHLALIVVHRTYISSRRMSAMSLPSLAICTNSARSIANIVEKQLQRGEYPITYLHTAPFQAGAILLLRIWGQKLSGIRVDYAKEMEDVKKCLDVLKHCERMVALSARRWDILNSLALGIESMDDGSPAAQATPPTELAEPISAQTYAATAEAQPSFPSSIPDIQNAAPDLSSPPFPVPSHFLANIEDCPVSDHYQALFESTLPPNPSMPSTHPSIQLAGPFEVAPAPVSYWPMSETGDTGKPANTLGNMPEVNGQTSGPTDPPVWQGVFTGSELDIWSSFFGEYGGDFQMGNAANPTPSSNGLFTGGFAEHY